MKRKKRKQRIGYLRFRKNDPAHNVLAAVEKWVKAHKGTVVIIGGIEVLRYPLDPLGKYRIAVPVLGKLPKKPEVKEKA